MMNSFLCSEIASSLFTLYCLEGFEKSTSIKLIELDLFMFTLLLLSLLFLELFDLDLLDSKITTSFHFFSNLFGVSLFNHVLEKDR